jgi:hypothetical protein
MIGFLKRPVCIWLVSHDESGSMTLKNKILESITLFGVDIHCIEIIQWCLMNLFMRKYIYMKIYKLSSLSLEIIQVDLPE